MLAERMSPLYHSLYPTNHKSQRYSTRPKRWWKRFWHFVELCEMTRWGKGIPANNLKKPVRMWRTSSLEGTRYSKRRCCPVFQWCKAMRRDLTRCQNSQITSRQRSCRYWMIVLIIQENWDLSKRDRKKYRSQCTSILAANRKNVKREFRVAYT